MNARIMRKAQAGVTLMEALIAMSISLVVTASMIGLMANSLGSTTRIVKMTKLTDDLRSAMQMMSRDLRRGNYNRDSMYCYANDDCTSDGSVTAVGDVHVNEAENCFFFLTDRGHDDYESAPMQAGGFRRVTSGGVGILEMWTANGDPWANGEDDGICDEDAGAAGWVRMTNPDNMDITTFEVVDDEDGLSYEVLVQDDGFGNTLTQRVRKLRMSLEGELVMDASMDNPITRRVEDIITVRNDLLL